MATIKMCASVCLAAALLLAGCGGNSSSSSDDSETETAMDQLNPSAMTVATPPDTLNGLSSDLKPLHN